MPSNIFATTGTNVSIMFLDSSEEWEDAILMDATKLGHKEKVDGKLIIKKRYLIPYGKYTIELDVFEGALAPLKFAEVEFASIEEAERFVAPDWFGEDVTFEAKYKNSNLI